MCTSLSLHRPAYRFGRGYAAEHAVDVVRARAADQPVQRSQRSAPSRDRAAGSGRALRRVRWCWRFRRGADGLRSRSKKKHGLPSGRGLATVLEQASEALLKGIGIAAREDDARVAAWSHEARDIGDRRRDVEHVLQHVEREHEVETANPSNGARSPSKARNGSPDACGTALSTATADNVDAAKRQRAGTGFTQQSRPTFLGRIRSRGFAAGETGICWSVWRTR